jgi:hypothetical protein
VCALTFQEIEEHVGVSHRHSTVHGVSRAA